MQQAVLLLCSIFFQATLDNQDRIWGYAKGVQLHINTCIYYYITINSNIKHFYTLGGRLKQKRNRKGNKYNR